MCASIETFGYPTIEFPYQNKEEVGVEVSINGIENEHNMSTLTHISSHNHAVETRLIR